MTGRHGVFGDTQQSFRLAYAALAVAAAALVLAAWHWVPKRDAHATPPVQPLPHTAIPSRDWGHAANDAAGMLVTLGPAADRRHRYQLGMSHVRFDSAAVGVSSDRGRTFHALEGEPMGRCGWHWQGWGVNAIVATRTCVPTWAVDAAGGHARQWLRIENLVPFARVVLVKFEAPLVVVGHGM